NGRQIVFDTDEGRRVYLDLLRNYADRFRLSLWAYCLMSNHVHLLAVPSRPDSLARALGRTHADYARYLNISRRSCGHVWQARYFSCVLDETHLWRAMAYIERNPIRAGLCRRAADYPWSSARAHVREDSLGGLLHLDTWRRCYDARTWEGILDANSDEEAFLQRLREATLRGRPCCDAGALRQFEKRLGRELHPQPAGRPRKQGKEAEQEQAAFAYAE
ncbi:MAG: transposase, partial [Bryobacteraceae bacterium]